MLINQGDGTFGAPIKHAVGASPNCLTAADLNGDGRDDLAFANGTSITVSVLLTACLP